MLSYAVRRLLGAIPTLLVILTITFFLVRLAPGGPFDGERTLPAEIERNLAAAYHLDEPLPLQYVRYLGQVLQGDFGPSFKYKDFSVTQLIWSGFPVSLQLGGTAMLLAVVIGTALGAFAALRQNSGLDYGVMGAAMVGIAVPNFVIAPLLTLVLGVHLGVLPTGGWGTWQQMLLPVAGTGAAADRLYRPHDQGQHDRAAALQLHPHRPRQGPAGAGDDLPPCAEGRRCCRWCRIWVPPRRRSSPARS